MNQTLHLNKNHSKNHLFRAIFMRGATFSTRGREISFLPGEFISHLAEIESPGGGNISAGGRLCKGAISFRVTGDWNTSFADTVSVVNFCKVSHMIIHQNMNIFSIIHCNMLFTRQWQQLILGFVHKYSSLQNMNILKFKNV